MHLNYIGSAKYDKIKRTDRIRKRATIHGEDNFLTKVVVFKELIQAVPYYVCIVCSCSLYYSGTIFSRNNHKSFADNFFSDSFFFCR